MLGPVYHIAGVAAQDATSDPRIVAMSNAGPWAACSFQSGALVFWRCGKDLPRPPKLSEYHDPVPTKTEGMTYYAPKVLPTQAELALDKRSEFDSDVQLESGVCLTVPCCFAAPRIINLATGDQGRFASEFGQIGEDLHACILVDEPLEYSDPRVLRLIYLAISARYRTTPELINDLGWITTGDIETILMHVWGSKLDPKHESGEAK